MSNVAASVRQSKEENPELYCAKKTCLWRTVTSRGPKPCQNHPHLGSSKPVVAPSTASPALTESR